MSSANSGVDGCSVNNSPKLEKSFLLEMNNNTLSLVSSYLSIFDADALAIAAKDLQKRAESCIWKPLAATMNLAAKVKNYTSAKETVEKEEFAVYYRFHQLAEINRGRPYNNISVNEANKEANITVETTSQATPITAIQDIRRKIVMPLLMSEPGALSIANITIQLPRDLNFPNLTQLNLRNLNSDHSIFSWICRLPNLRKLSLKNMGLTTLPSKVLDCTKLVSLDLRNNVGDVKHVNHIRELPDALCNFSQLTVLKLDNLNLTTLSPVYQLTSLEILSLSDNPDLVNLSDNISKLCNLSFLSVANIGLTTWPIAFLQLKKMCVLDISKNNIQEIPLAFKNWLTHIMNFVHDDNPWSETAQATLRDIQETRLLSQL